METPNESSKKVFEEVLEETLLKYLSEGYTITFEIEGKEYFLRLVEAVDDTETDL